MNPAYLNISAALTDWGVNHECNSMVTVDRRFDCVCFKLICP